MQDGRSDLITRPPQADLDEDAVEVEVLAGPAVVAALVLELGEVVAGVDHARLEVVPLHQEVQQLLAVPEQQKRWILRSRNRNRISAHLDCWICLVTSASVRIFRTWSVSACSCLNCSTTCTTITKLINIALKYQRLCAQLTICLHIPMLSCPREWAGPPGRGRDSCARPWRSPPCRCWRAGPASPSAGPSHCSTPSPRVI